MGPVGIWELIFIFVLAFLIFGPKKLPELGRTLGSALTEFRRASNELRHAFNDEMRDLERQAREVESGVEQAVIAPARDAMAGSADLNLDLDAPTQAPAPRKESGAAAEPAAEAAEPPDQSTHGQSTSD